jgi:protocatechuate 4,5-dioxygenase beta chain/2,3-dihydroxyphenylpropionate 1,2-dioxygenase
LEAARPDVIVGISNDHMTNFFLNNMPAFCVGIADVYPGPPPEFEPITGVKARRFPGHVELGRAILREAFDSGFDPAFSGELVFDDNFAGPLHFLTPEKEIPLVLILINAAEPPLPSLQRCYQFGAVLRRAIEKQTVAQRVALLGTGGISHWVGTPEMGQINTAFDQKILDQAFPNRIPIGFFLRKQKHILFPCAMQLGEEDGLAIHACNNGVEDLPGENESRKDG